MNNKSNKDLLRSLQFSCELGDFALAFFEALEKLRMLLVEFGEGALGSAELLFELQVPLTELHRAASLRGLG